MSANLKETYPDGKLPVILRYPHIDMHNVAENFVASMAVPEGGDEVDTGGWDTAYAIPVEDVNKAIARKKKSPSSFSQSEKDGTDTVTASGTFGDWQIATDGSSGGNLHMDLPLVKATMKRQGVDYDLSGSTVIIEIKLDFFRVGASGGVESRDLKVKTDAGTAQEPIVSVVDIKTPAGVTIPFIAKAVFGGVIGEWLNNNLADFEHVFATADINLDLDDKFGWLKPTYTGYAYAQARSTGKHLFGILSMTGKNGEARGNLLDSQLSPFSIPSGAPSGFVLSPHIVMENIVGPSLSGVFEGIDSTKVWEHFEVVGGTEIRSTKAITMPVEVKGDNYTGKIDVGGFTLAIEGDRLTLKIPKLEIEYSPGITVTLDLTEYVSIGLQDQPTKGGKVLWLHEIKNTVTHEVHIADWVTGIEIGVDIVVAMVASAIGIGKGVTALIEKGMSKIMARILVAIAIALATGIAAAITNIPTYIALAAGHKFDEFPDFGEITGKGIDSIKWPDSSGFKLINAGLNHSLVLGIDPQLPA